MKLSSNKFGIDNILHFYYQSCSTNDLIGIEVEFFCIDALTSKPLPFVGIVSISKILHCFKEYYNYEAYEDNVFELKRDQELISVEPGGQIEYSSPSCNNLAECKSKLANFLSELTFIMGVIGGVKILSCGILPSSYAHEIVTVPKERYFILSEYLKKNGTHGEEMMKATASIHVNIDYQSELMAMKMFQVLHSTSSIFSAIFGNSKYIDSSGREYKIYRKEIWNKTDANRCGILTDFIVGEKKFIDYINLIIKTPIIYIYRRPNWINVGGQLNFIEFINNGYNGINATLEDYHIHLNSIFHDIRIKKYIEIRGVDAQPIKKMLEPAFFLQKILKVEALDKILNLLSFASPSDFLELQKTLPILGMDAKLGNVEVRLIANELWEIANMV